MDRPTCPEYGRGWDARDIVCRGGTDPTYINPAKGTNERDICKWYNACCQQTLAARQQLVPPQQLVRQPQQSYPQVSALAPGHQQAPVQVPVQYPHQQVQQVRVNMPQQLQQVRPAPAQMVPAPMPAMMQGYAGPMMVQPGYAATPWMVPMNYAAPYMQMPGYLTVPEPYVEGQHWAARLGLTLARAMLKAAGHTVSNYFDHTSFNPWTGPPQQG